MKKLSKYRAKKMEVLWKEFSAKEFCYPAVAQIVLHVPELSDRALAMFLRPENLGKCLSDAYWLGMIFENMTENRRLVCAKLIELMEVNWEAYIYGESRLELMAKFPETRELASQAAARLKALYALKSKRVTAKERKRHQYELFEKILKTSGREERKLQQVYAGNGLGDAL